MESDTGDISSLQDLDGFKLALLTQLQSSRCQVDILNYNLDPCLFDDQDICSELTRISRDAGRRAQIRILVREVDALIKRRHHLVATAQRLSSVIQLRRLTEAPSNDHMNYVISDRQQLLYQYENGVYDGYQHPDKRPAAQSLLEEFDRLWNYHSEELTDIKRLHL